jgi:hypothetical protein
MPVVSKRPLDFDSDEDVEYANCLFESLAFLYRVCAKLLYPSLANHRENDFAVKKKVLVEIEEFNQALLRLPVVTDTVLLEVVQMMRKSADYCSRRNNIALTKSSNHDVIKMMLEKHRHRKLQSAGRELSRYLKTR